MKQFFYLSAIFFSIITLTNAMELVEQGKRTALELEDFVPAFQFNDRIKIVDEKERKDAEFFIGCLQVFKDTAEKTLDMHKSGYQRLTDKEISWLDHHILATSIDTFKVQENNCAVYRKVCSMRLAGPNDVDYVLGFWHKLLRKKKISPELYNKQREQIEKLYLFFSGLERQGIIAKYPRTVNGKVVFKAAL